jgi:hypothetical protein
MTRQKLLLIVLTAVNFGLLAFLLTRIPGAEVQGQAVPDVMRARRLEIVDGEGRVRASIRIEPPDSRFNTPETVMLRLVDANGRPEVKLGASVDGAGLGLIGSTDATQAILTAQGLDSSLKVANGNGRETRIQP